MTGRPQPAHAVRKRSLTIAGHRTSLSLEQAFWDALKEIARSEGLSVATLVARIDRERQGNLSSAVRVYVLEFVRGKRPYPNLPNPSKDP